MPRNPFVHPASSRRKNPTLRTGQEVSKQTRVVGKRIAGALRAEFARSQKRRDGKRR